MNTNTIPDEVLETLVESDRNSNDGLVLRDVSRASLEVAVEEILVDRPKLYDHIRRLLATLGAHFRHKERLPDELTDLVVKRGLQVLGDSDLAALILNPVALYVLFDEIHEQLPETWLAVMERQGRSLWEDEVRPAPPRNALPDSWLAIMERHWRSLWEAEGRPVPNFRSLLQDALNSPSPTVAGTCELSKERMLPKRKKPSPETMRSLVEKFRHREGNLSLVAIMPSAEAVSDCESGSELRYGLLGSLRIGREILEFYQNGNLVLASYAGEPLSVLEIDGVPYALTRCKEFERAVAVEGLAQEWIARVIQDLKNDATSHKCQVR